MTSTLDTCSRAALCAFTVAVLTPLGAFVIGLACGAVVNAFEVGWGCVR